MIPEAAVPAPLALLRDRLPLDGPVQVVDIGANPINGDPPYKPLLRAGMAHVWGFEPQAEAHAALIAAKSDDETYIRGAVGDGQTGTLHVYGSSGFTSLFPLRPETVRLLDLRRTSTRLTGRFEVETLRLDDLDQIGGIDFLKIDIQGGELAVLRNGRGKLRHTLALQTEMRFLPLYQGEPGFADLNAELTSQGFEFHNLVALNRFRVAGSRGLGLKARHGSQLVDGDAIYIRGLTALSGQGSAALARLAVLASGCFGSHDLALACLAVLVRRGEVAADLPAAYAGALSQK